MKTNAIRMRGIFAVSAVCALLTGVIILWLGQPRPSGPVALLAAVPFIVLARYAWHRMRRPGTAG